MKLKILYGFLTVAVLTAGVSVYLNYLPAPAPLSTGVVEAKVPELEPKEVFVATLTKERLIDYILDEEERITRADAETLVTQVINWSNENKVPVIVTLSVIDVETNFKPYSVSKKDAHCHMQIVPKVWSEEFQRLKIDGFPKEVRELHDIGTCVQWGTKILQVLHKRHKTWGKAVCNYNPGACEKYLSSVKNASIRLTWSTM